MTHVATSRNKRKIFLGLFGVVAALFISTSPAAAAEITPSDNNALLTSM